MLRRVVSIVISFHLLCVAALLFAPVRTPAVKGAHVKVRTVRPVAAVATKKTVSPAVSRPIPQPSSKPRPQNKPSSPKPAPVAKKKSAPTKKPTILEKKKPVIKKVELQKPAISAEIWDEIDQALAKIEQNSYSKRRPSLERETPALLPNAVVQESEESHSMLVGFLHEALHLPEMGEVKIQLTVRKNGTVANVVVLSAASHKNKLYLQEHLPNLQFPMHFDEEKTWTLTFCNEI